jgi:broad specificity phosphatase PhoE
MFKKIAVYWRRFCVFVPAFNHFIRFPLIYIIIRHAESVANAELQGALYRKNPPAEFTGDSKLAITKRGIEQALQTGKKLTANYGAPQYVVHSGYRRTIQTTEKLLDHIQHSILLEGFMPFIFEDKGFREREGGYTSVLVEEEALTHFPFLPKYWRTVGHLFARPVGGESLMDVIEKRLRYTLEKTFKRFRGKVVWQVGHGRTTQCQRIILDDMTIEQAEAFLNYPDNTPINCGVTVYRYDPVSDSMKLDVYNKVYWAETVQA